MSELDVISFQTAIQQEGSFIFVVVPFVPHVVWGKKPRYRVHGTINGMLVRGTLGMFEQSYFLRLSAVWVRTSGVTIGATVSVILTCANADK